MGQIICNGTEVKTLIYNGTTIAEEGYTVEQYNTYGEERYNAGKSDILSRLKRKFIVNAGNDTAVTNDFYIIDDSSGITTFGQAGISKICISGENYHVVQIKFDIPYKWYQPTDTSWTTISSDISFDISLHYSVCIYSYSVCCQYGENYNIVFN